MGFSIELDGIQSHSFIESWRTHMHAINYVYCTCLDSKLRGFLTPSPPTTQNSTKPPRVQDLPLLHSIQWSSMRNLLGFKILALLREEGEREVRNGREREKMKWNEGSCWIGYRSLQWKGNDKNALTYSTRIRHFTYGTRSDTVRHGYRYGIQQDTVEVCDKLLGYCFLSFYEKQKTRKKLLTIFPFLCNQ